MIVRARFTKEGAERKGVSELAGVEVEAVITQSRFTTADEIIYQGKRVCGTASYAKTNEEMPTLELLEHFNLKSLPLDR